MHFKKICLVVFFIFIAITGQGCTVPGPTIGDARDKLAQGQTDIVAAGSVVAKYISSSTGDDEESASETVSYKVVDSQGVNFYVLSTRPLDEGTSYVFTFDNNGGLGCSELEPCIYTDVRQSAFNYFMLIIPVVLLYFAGFFITRHFYNQTGSLALENVLRIVYWWYRPPTRSKESYWCDEARPNTVTLYVERVTIRKKGKRYDMDIVPESHQVVAGSDGKLVVLVSDKNTALCKREQANSTLNKNDTMHILTDDLDGNVKVWGMDSVDVIPLTTVPSWFVPNLVLQCWFQPNSSRVFVRGGLYTTADPGLLKPTNIMGDQMHIGGGGGNYNPMTITWTRVKPDEYIAITKARNNMKDFVSFDCPQKIHDIVVDEAAEASWDLLAGQDGFYRVKIKCG